MKTIGKTGKVLALLLAVLLILAGCTTGGESSSSGGSSDASLDSTNAAMGRFVEESFAVPEGVGYITGFNQLADGSYRMVANDSNDNMLGNWDIWESTDNGKTWTKLDLPWLEQLKDTTVMKALFVSAEEMYLHYQTQDEELDEKVNALFEAGDNEGAMKLRQESEHFARASSTELTELPYVPVGDENYMTLQGLTVADENTLWADFYSQIARIDKETGKQLVQIESLAEYGGAQMVARDGKVYMAAKGKINVYDADNGELLNEMAVGDLPNEDASGGIFYGGMLSSLIAVGAEEGLVYYLDTTGIYAVTEESVLVERLVDGALTSLTMPSVHLRKFYHNEDDSFTVLGEQEEEKRIYTYRYDSAVPTAPSKELVVYSLKKNDTLQQAIGMYQLANPDTKVTLEIGATGADGVSIADALRNLSTEILAGKGPDVLVLDGIPIDSYREKGILKDLSGALGEDHGLLPNMVENAKKDGGIYAIPARFSTYLTMGMDMGELENLADIISWYATQGNTPLGIYTEELTTLYPAYSQEWFYEDGTLNKENLLKTLRELAKLSELGGPIGEDHYGSTGDYVMSGILFKYNKIALGIGSFDSFNNLQFLYAGMKSRGEGEVKTYPAGEKQYYIPKTLLGVNAQSKLADDAEKFILFTLSKEVLVNNFDDGLPTNLEALKESGISPYPEGDDGMYMGVARSTEDEDTGEHSEPETLEIAVNWPEPAQIEKTMKDIEGLNTPVLSNSVVDDIVHEELEKMFEGGTESKQTPEETADAIEQKLALYLAEQ